MLHSKTVRGMHMPAQSSDQDSYIETAEAAEALALKHAQEGTMPANEDNPEEDALDEEPLIGL